jgi:hypothetical protein
MYCKVILVCYLEYMSTWGRSESVAQQCRQMPLKPRASNFTKHIILNIVALNYTFFFGHKLNPVMYEPLYCRQNYSVGITISPLTEKGGKYLNAPWGRMKEVRRPIYQPSSIIGLGRLVTSYIGELPIHSLSLTYF